MLPRRFPCRKTARTIREKGKCRMAKRVSETAGEVPEKKKQLRSLLNQILMLLLKLAVFAVMAVILFGYVFGLTRNSGLGMQPSFCDGDLVLFYRIAGTYSADEVVVVRYRGEKLLERVVAVAGDEVDITAYGLMINGAPIQEPDVWGETTQFEEGVSFPLRVPEGKVFVLADNREHATDSRVFGCVDTEDVYGRVIGLFRRRNL